MTDFWILSPIYDRVIVKCRVRDESGIYFFVWEKFWSNVDLIKVSRGILRSHYDETDRIVQLLD